jgi:hypothetical protein
LAFVADFGTQNFHLKTNFDMEHKTSTNHENGNDANRLLAAVLSKYIQYIKDVEGTDYILIHDNRYASNVEFTDEEWQLLTEVAKNCG